MFQTFFGESLYKAIYRINDTEKRMMFLVDQVERITGLKDFGVYLNRLFTIDAFFLNEDRHTHNIAVLMNGEGKFAYCPIFDNGASLLADTKMDYPLGIEVHELINQPKAKTICIDFDEQLEISETLYGQNLRFTFTKSDVKTLLANICEYSAEEKKRVEELIYEQMRKYRYLFE